MSRDADKRRVSRSKLEVASRVAEGIGVGPLMRRLPVWEGAVAIAYHRIGQGSESLYDRTTWEATAEAFDLQMAFLKRSFDVVSPSDLVELQRSRARGRHVVVTFDDGYRDTYEHAFASLRAHGLTATFFVTTGFVDQRLVAWWDEVAWLVRTSTRAEVRLPDRFPGALSLLPGERGATIRNLVALFKSLPDDDARSFLDELATAVGRPRHRPADGDPWMTWDMIREMRDAGMTIGGHTMRHPVLARCSTEQQAEEILGSKRRLEEQLGEPMRFFSYPNGTTDSFDERTRDILRDGGVELAFSFYGGYRRRYHGWDPYDVPRRAVVAGASMQRFSMELTLPGLFPNW